MMDTIAQRLLESVGWGLKMRLYTGAGLSTMDLLSDLYMIYTYAKTGQRGTAVSLAVMVGLCLASQCVNVWLQTHRGPRRVMLRELLIVLTGVAPGVHAMRVANGVQKSEYATVNPDIELTCSRSMEMVFESVPGSIVTAYAMLRGMEHAESGSFDKRAAASIVVSALTTGFSAATISFE
jgi:hypothetical protein